MLAGSHRESRVSSKRSSQLPRQHAIRCAFTFNGGVILPLRETVPRHFEEELSRMLIKPNNTAGQLNNLIS